MDVTSQLPLSDLRAERRRLGERAARLSWVRRLVAARSDLEVARLAGVTACGDELDPVTATALALDGVRGPDLLHALQAASRRLDDECARAQEELDALTGELVERLTHDPAACLVR